MASRQLPLPPAAPKEISLPSCNQFGWAHPTTATLQLEPQVDGRSRTGPKLFVVHTLRNAPPLLHLEEVFGR